MRRTTGRTVRSLPVLSLAAIDFRYSDPSKPEPDIDLPLIQSIAAELRGCLLGRLQGRP